MWQESCRFYLRSAISQCHRRVGQILGKFVVPSSLFVCLGLTSCAKLAVVQITPTVFQRTPGSEDIAAANPPQWETMPSFVMKGDLKAFWSVYGGDRENNENAIKKGFQTNTVVGTLRKEEAGPGKDIIGSSDVSNPWQKPAFFEEVVRLNSAHYKQAPRIYHNIEIALNWNADQLWEDAKLRTLSKAKTKTEFIDRYFQEWATWHTLPLQWARQLNPKATIGLYGQQVFQRDYWKLASATREQVAAMHRESAQLWQHIDPFVDYYITDVYYFYDQPDSVYYLAANVEENYLGSLKYAAPNKPPKPLYTFSRLRYTPGGNRLIQEKQIYPYLAEAAAVVPYFTGAKGVTLWGWEPNTKGQVYYNMPAFMRGLSRVAKVSEQLSKAKLVIDQPAYLLWQQKAPLVRKMQVSNTEWVVMLIDPWQAEDKNRDLSVSLNNQTFSLNVKGKTPEIYYIQNAKVTRY
jgi:hypothetical protein